MGMHHATIKSIQWAISTEMVVEAKSYNNTSVGHL